MIYGFLNCFPDFRSATLEATFGLATKPLTFLKGHVEGGD